MCHQKHDLITTTPLTQIYINSMEKKITFKIKSGYYFDVLTVKTIKLLGSTDRRKTDSKDEENIC